MPDRDPSGAAARSVGEAVTEGVTESALLSEAGLSIELAPLVNARTGERYELVPARDADTPVSDIAAIVSVCNEPAIYDLLFAERCAGRPYAAADAERFLSWAARGWQGGTHFVYLIRCESGEVAGAIDIKSANRESAEIGYWLSAAHSGVMTNAVIALLERARAAGYAELHALVRPTNIRSANVLKRAGFTAGRTMTRNNIVYDRWEKRLPGEE